MQFQFRNVNDAFRTLVQGFHDGSIATHTQPSRAGEVMAVEEPVVVTFTHPCERVLFNRARDANPFFHLFESLWMLASRRDVAPLAYYNSNIASYSDDGKIFNSPYGYRWRSSFAVDQLTKIIVHLIRNPESRRAVLQIWSVPYDLLRIDTTKDNACNTHVYFAISNGKLNMTVCNRSNDLIWGLLGANVVHFSMLQEYLAACIGVKVGRYHQMTNNLHVYTKRWEPEKWLSDFVVPLSYPPVVPLVQHPSMFDEECKRFVNSIDGEFKEPFLRNTAQPMCAAFRRHKRRQYLGDDNALRLVGRVDANDWSVAGYAWIWKRKEMWEAKSRVDLTPHPDVEEAS